MSKIVLVLRKGVAPGSARGSDALHEQVEAIFNTHLACEGQRLLELKSLALFNFCSLLSLNKKLKIGWVQNVCRPKATEATYFRLCELGKAHQITKHVTGIYLFHPNLPTDVRHNAKINREQLSIWAAKHPKVDFSFRR